MNFSDPKEKLASMDYIDAPERNILQWLNDFKRDESGVLLVFSLFIISIFLMIGGLGVDLMRAENARTNLQHTLDRAVLAASDLDQTLDPTAVVTDYFTKAGLAEHLTNVTVESGIGYRVVSANANYQLDTILMDMNNVNQLSIPSSGTAEERIDGVEISMVLDVSGSMGSNNRLTNLQSAARDFIDTVSEASEDGKLSISIVPYATQVTAGATLLNEYNVSTEHNYSHCVNFESADFNATGLSTSTPLQRTDHFDVFTYSRTIGDNSDYGNDSMPVCATDSSSAILPLSKNKTVLKNAISALTAGGNTSIDIGMKWGTTLLDPGTQGVVSNLVSNGAIHNDFQGRPTSYSSSDTLKVIVLMTDGQNTNQYFLNDAYKNGNSDVWIDSATKRASIYKPSHYGYEKYFHVHDRRWRTTPYGQSNGTAHRMTYRELWDEYSVAENLTKNYGRMNRWNDWTHWYNNVFYGVGTGTKNARLHSICEAAKDQGIIVFTIGFEAPSGGQTVLKSCASSDSHYFDVNGIEISDAFSSIASSIRKLRLTN